MIEVEGYKVFEGVLRVSPKNGMTPFEMYGKWIYKPYIGWCGSGCIFVEEICEVIEDVKH